MKPRILHFAFMFLVFMIPVAVRCDYIKGASYFAQGKYELAIKEYEEELRVDPAYVQGHYIVGLCYARLKNYDKAIESLKKAQTLDKGNFQIALALAQAYFDAGKYAELSDALSLAGQNARTPTDEEKIRFLKASSLFNQQNYAQAVPELQGAVTASPHNAVLQAQLGMAYYHLQKYDEAIAALNVAASLNPNDPQAGLYLGEAHFARAATLTVARERTKGFTEAARIADQWAEKQPRSFETLSLAGRAALALKNYIRAVSYLKKAADLQPDSATTQFNLGQACAFAGQYPEAEAALTEASKTLTTEPTLFSMLGFVLEKENKPAGAQSAYERANALAPSPDLQSSIERVKQKQNPGRTDKPEVKPDSSLL